MRKAKGFFFMLTVMLLLMVGWSGEALSQEKYPTRPIEIIVTFSPGGSIDLSARLTAAYLSKKWGVPVNVVNKPGGNSIPGQLELYRAAPDGYTMLNDNQGNTTMLEAFTKDLPFKTMERTYVAMYSTVPNVLMVSPDAPWKTLKDIAAEAIRDPANMTWTSLGSVGALDHAVRQFFRAIGVDYLKTRPIIAKGGSQTVTLTAGGHAKLGCATTSSSIPSIKGGTVRALAITSPERFSSLPDVPTTAELGYPQVNLMTWIGIAGPPKLPSHIVAIWDKALREMIQDQEVVSKMQAIGGAPFYRNSKDAREYITNEIAELIKWK